MLPIGNFHGCGEGDTLSRSAGGAALRGSGKCCSSAAFTASGTSTRSWYILETRVRLTCLVSSTPKPHQNEGATCTIAHTTTTAYEVKTECPPPNSDTIFPICSCSLVNSKGTFSSAIITGTRGHIQIGPWDDWCGIARGCNNNKTMTRALPLVTPEPSPFLRCMAKRHSFLNTYTHRNEQPVGAEPEVHVRSVSNAGRGGEGWSWETYPVTVLRNEHRLHARDAAKHYSAVCIHL